MKNLNLKILAAIVFLGTMCGYFFIFGNQEPVVYNYETTTRSVLFVTKPYPLNDWDYVKNPGGYLIHKEISEEEITNKSEEKSEQDGSPSAADAPVDDVTKETTTKPSTSQYIIKASHYAVAAKDIYFTYPIREYTEEQKTLIAKMLYCEARGEGWDCQVATCSAIINHIEANGGNFGVLDKKNHFSPASYYRYKTPTQMNWKVLNYVLSGHLIANVKYFQLYRYHSFGSPMFSINGTYFSK